MLVRNSAAAYHSVLRTVSFRIQCTPWSMGGCLSDTESDLYTQNLNTLNQVFSDKEEGYFVIQMVSQICP
jgi:hypothetical protein